MLGVTDDGILTVLRDTRPGASAARHELDGLRRSVYRAADRALPREALVRAVQKDQGPRVGWREIEPELEELMEKRLLLAISGRYTSLGVREPVADYPSVHEIPEGFVRIGPALRALAPLSLAREAKDPSIEMPDSLAHFFP